MPLRAHLEQARASGAQIDDSQLNPPPMPSEALHLLPVFSALSREREYNCAGMQAIKSRDILVLLPDALPVEMDIIRAIDDEFLKAYRNG